MSISRLIARPLVEERESQACVGVAVNRWITTTAAVSTWSRLAITRRCVHPRASAARAYSQARRAYRPLATEQVAKAR